MTNKIILNDWIKRLNLLESYFAPDNTVEKMTDFAFKMILSVPSSPNQNITVEQVKNTPEYNKLFSKIKEAYRKRLPIQ